MTFELWDTESHNLIAAYDSEAAALKVVRESLEHHGREFVATIALVCEDDQGDDETIASGSALVKLAESRAT